MITEAQTRAVADYCAKHPQVAALYLYGSHSRGTANALSDIDIAVMLAKPSDASGDIHLDVKRILDAEGHEVFTLAKPDDVALLKSLDQDAGR